MEAQKQGLIAIVGEENVLNDLSALASYASDQSFARPRKPWFVARPRNVEEVQKLVLWANEARTPLIPVSSGAPHFHGDTVPSTAEAVIVDLSRMKGIKRIDRRNKVVVIEPGVTYAELGPALKEHGLRISKPLLPRANKSVVASLLERQPTLIPRLNYTLIEPLRACGVVWGSGEMSFTGEAGMGPLSLEVQWEQGVVQIDPKGPFSTDYVRLLTGAQGSMGIVIWASVKCELIPSVHKYRFVPGEKLEDLVDFCRRLQRLRLGDEVMVLNRAQVAYMVGKQDSDVSALREELPAWVVVIGLAGAAYFPEERVQVQEKDLSALAQEFGVELLASLPGVSAAEIAGTLDSLSGEPYWKLRHRGACQDIFFLTTLDKAPQFVQTVRCVADACKYPARDIGIYIQPQHHGTSQHVEFSLRFDPADAKEAAKVKEIYTKASELLIAQGAYFSRPYGDWAGMVYSRDATATRVLRTVKRIVDPNNVMNPGKLCF